MIECPGSGLYLHIFWHCFSRWLCFPARTAARSFILECPSQTANILWWALHKCALGWIYITIDNDIIWLWICVNSLLYFQLLCISFLCSVRCEIATYYSGSLLSFSSNSLTFPCRHLSISGHLTSSSSIGSQAFVALLQLSYGTVTSVSERAVSSTDSASVPPWAHRNPSIIS